MPPCLRCRTTVFDTKVLAVRRYYGFRSLVCASWCSEEGKQVQQQKLRCLCSLEAILLAELMIQPNNSFVSKNSTSPAVMFTSRLVLPRAMTWTEKSACVANSPHLHKHTRALPAACCCYGVAVLRLVLVLLLQLPIALSSLLIPCNEKPKEKKNVTKSKESKELREGSFPQQLIFSSANTG